ncbi:nuclear transport factor 2 family protein [Microbacterium sp. Marseille-Q6965]|uniref:nuclear transport factor 2 family protein n=1 Tax=Microbacterium sp. Marseille-Q6965 TaxID=2965072 RepID=UPI0021B7E29F|nr:nuclear transport factor 2 family protein [Microbacterium sp. Marseille-Q6965]
MPRTTNRAAVIGGIAIAAFVLAGCTNTTTPDSETEENPMANELTPAEIVSTATTAVFGERDLSAIDEYFGPTYTQHSTLAADGLEGLRTLAGSLPDNFRYEPARLLAEGELVVTQGTYYGFGPDALTGYDVWRVEDGKIVEHWDSLTPVVGETASGRSQTDGPTEVTDLDKTAENKQLVTDFAEQVLVGGDYSLLTDYISTEQYDQHNPEAADGLAAFGAAVEQWAAEGKTLDYKKVHQVIAQGNFVFTRAEGNFGVPSIYNDLWRVQDGKIVEHWDVVIPVPTERPHTNGVF